MTIWSDINVSTCPLTSFVRRSACNLARYELNDRQGFIDSQGRRSLVISGCWSSTNVSTAPLESSLFVCADIIVISKTVHPFNCRAQRSLSVRAEILPKVSLPRMLKRKSAFSLSTWRIMDIHIRPTQWEWKTDMVCLYGGSYHEKWFKLLEICSKARTMSENLLYITNFIGGEFQVSNPSIGYSSRRKMCLYIRWN